MALLPQGTLEVGGESGAYSAPAARLLITVEAAASSRRVSHLAHVTASADVPVLPDGSFGPVRLKGIEGVDPILPGHVLDIQAFTADRTPGPFARFPISPAATP